MLFLICFDCHFLRIKWVEDNQLSSTLIMVFSCFIIFRNSIAHYYHNTRFAYEFSDRDILIILWYFMPRSFLRTSYIKGNFASIPARAFRAVLIYYDFQILALLIVISIAISAIVVRIFYLASLLANISAKYSLFFLALFTYADTN